jgi:4'-phosphopantetheinyl transferase
MTSRTPTESPALLWPASESRGTITRGEIHVWAWAFAGAIAPAEEDLRVLDDYERQRTGRFHFVPDRVRYSVCHANMRRILASYLGQAPESLSFREGPGGKPELVPQAVDPLRFNLSHSKSIALLAVALEAEVGVDVEDVRPIEPGVAERHFSAAELAGMAELRGKAWLDAFYRCWTRKEAILKAEGVGLRIPLDSFDVSVLPDEPAGLLASRPEAKLTAEWRLHHLAPAAGTTGALAVNSPSAQVLPMTFVN